MSLRVVAAYLLAVLGGNANPDAAAISKIVSSVGIDVDSAHVTQLLGELKGKNVYDVIAAGKAKLQSVPTGGAAPAAAAPAKEVAHAKEEKGKKEEAKPKKEEKKESEEDLGGFGLFDE